MAPRRGGNRSSLIDDDALLGSSDSRDTDYHNFSIDASDTSSSPGSGVVGKVKGWWADNRKRRFIIGGITATLILLIIASPFALRAGASKEHGGGAHGGSSSSSTGGGGATGAISGGSTGGADSTGSGYSSSSSAMPPPPPPNPEAPWLSPRLPTSTRPTHYDVYEAINIDQRVFGGTVDIALDIAQPLSHLVLHSVSLFHSSVKLTTRDGASVPLTHWIYRPNSYLVLNFTSSERVAAQQGARLSIAYGGVLRDDSTDGLYLSSYYANDSDSAPLQYMASTQFEALGARIAFPCFDEPGFKATFSLTLKTSPNYPTVLSNMPAIRSTVLPSGEVETQFNKTVVMSTYLVAVAVTDYVYSEQITTCATSSGYRANITTRVWAPNGLYNATIYPARIAAAQIAYYCRYFDVPYPLVKEDHIMVPSFAPGAMENWGLITYRASALLWDPAVNSVVQLQRVSVVIAHELAHMWFGNLVTAQWWTSLWLNEGFATFVEYIGAGYTDPQLQLADQFVSVAQRQALAYDSGRNTHPIIDERGTSGITYAKGGSVIRMMEAQLTRPVFLAGIKQYLLAKSYQNAVSTDLFGYLDAASAAAGQRFNVTSFMAQWTQRAGYPLVNCSTYSSDGTTRWQCRQSRFFTYPNPPTDATLWQIPMTGSSSRGPYAESFGIWPQTERSYEFAQPAAASWLKLNANSTGFYRVMYDQPTWHRLSDVLNAPGSSQMMYHDDRLGLVGDVYTFAEQSLLSYAQVLNISVFLQHERMFTVWQVAHPALVQLYNRLRYTEAGPSMAEYMQQALSAAAADVDVLNTTRASAAEELLVNTIGSSIIRFNAAGKRSDLLTLYQRLYAGWPFTSFTDIDPSLLGLVLQVGVAEGSIEGWRWVYTNVWVEKTRDPQDDPAPALDLGQTLSILGSARRSDVIRQVLNQLNTTSNAALFPGDATVALLGHIASNDFGLPLYNEWVAQPGVLAALNATVPAQYMRLLISTTLALNTDMATVDRLTGAYNGAALGYDISQAISEGRSGATANARWAAQHYQPLATYLSSAQWRRRTISSSTGGAWH